MTASMQSQFYLPLTVTGLEGSSKLATWVNGAPIGSGWHSPVISTSAMAVSEDQGLPIGHDSEIALTKDFAIGGAQ